MAHQDVATLFSTYSDYVVRVVRVDRHTEGPGIALRGLRNFGYMMHRYINQARIWNARAPKAATMRYPIDSQSL